VVAVEYFSKWIEAKPLATITSATVQKNFWQNIVCRFGVSKAITLDNGTQFDAKAFKEFCEQIGTKIHLHRLGIRSQMDLSKELMAL
jgi:transposase InsO family protein